MRDKLKKLTGKNPADFKPVAFDTINVPDIELFEELVKSEDFLFDFIKRNVAQRLQQECNGKNYKNLLKFLKFYSPSYEEFIISTLVKYADEDLTDELLELFENGIEDEKTYCAKYFSYIQDPLSIELLKKYAYSENSYLSSNCASTLSAFGEKDSYNDAIEKLQSEDEFERLNGVKFLVSYGDKKAVSPIIQAIKTSHFAENMAGEILYLTDLTELMQNNFQNGLFILNTVINALGEILSPAQILDFGLYDVFKNLIQKRNNDANIVLLNAIDKFNTLTENDEYLYDETKDTKQEVFDIKKLLSTLNSQELTSNIDSYLNINSGFIYTALEFSKNYEKMRNLLTSANQTVILKVIEILKRANELKEQDKMTALEHITNEDIKNIINAI